MDFLRPQSSSPTLILMAASTLLRISAGFGALYTVSMVGATITAAKFEHDMLKPSVTALKKKLEEMSQEEKIASLFSLSDADHNGTLDKQEVSGLVNKIVGAAFLECWQVVQPLLPLHDPSLNSTISMIVNKPDEVLEEMFNKNPEIRADYDNLITIIMDTLDVDHDGRVTLEEFTTKVPEILNFCSAACENMLHLNLTRKVGIWGIGSGVGFSVGCWWLANWLESSKD